MIKEISIFTIATVGIAVAIYVYLKKRSSSLVIKEEVVDATLSMNDVVGFFKSKSLIKGKNIPFVANGDCQEFREMFHAPYPKAKDGYKAIFLGVYNKENDTISDHVLIHAKDIDKDIAEMFGANSLVVLQ